MKAFPLAALAALVLTAAAAQETDRAVAIRVVVDEDGNQTSWTGNRADLDGLAVGETRVVQSDDGEPMTITRTEDGMTLSVNGEVVELPPIGVHPMPHFMAHAAPGDEDMVFDVRTGPGIAVGIEGPGPHMAFRAAGPHGVTIVSDEPLDESVKDSIRSVLISAGRDDEVRFIDSSNGPMRFIEKRVELEQPN